MQKNSKNYKCNHIPHFKECSTNRYRSDISYIRTTLYKQCGLCGTELSYEQIIKYLEKTYSKELAEIIYKTIIRKEGYLMGANNIKKLGIDIPYITYTPEDKEESKHEQ